MSSAWIYLVRHGSVVAAETRRFIGHLDVPLSPSGEAEMERLATRLAGVPLVAVYASDLDRSRRSAEIIARPHRLTPQLLPELREMAMGRWEGLTADEINAREPDAFKDWMARVGEFPFPGGESVPDLLARVWPVFERIVSAHQGGRVAIVAHGGTNRVILCRALGVPLERLLAFGQDYGALSLLEWRGSRAILHLLNQPPPP
ncbi:MAG: alpha-ribazole phosphatase [Candidatus Rokubacteria bacterium]|nr:alpha-ribazole phosphatase [Candidatus Rokubacteria bacterium]